MVGSDDQISTRQCDKMVDIINYNYVHGNVTHNCSSLYLPFLTHNFYDQIKLAQIKNVKGCI